MLETVTGRPIWYQWVLLIRNVETLLDMRLVSHIGLWIVKSLKESIRLKEAASSLYKSDIAVCTASSLPNSEYGRYVYTA